MAEAKNNCKEIDVVFPEKINLSEAEDYHIAFINLTPNESTLKYDAKVNFQVVNQISYERCKNSYIQLGYNRVVIFHNPTLPYDKPELNEQKVIGLQADDSKDELIKELQAKIEALSSVKVENNTKTDAKKDNGSKGAKNTSEKVVNENEITNFEVNAGNVVEFAEKNGIDITAGKSLEEKVAIVNIWIAEKQ